MKFTSAVNEFWSAIQEPGPRCDEAVRQWDAVSKEARESLEGLKGHLSEPAYRFFTQSSFHDGSVVSIKVVDRRTESAVGRKFRWFRFPTSVEILIRHPDTCLLWALTYRRVRRLNLETTDSDSNDEEHGFFEWGYDRLSAEGDHTLRHEILFSSGAALELSFEQLTLKRAGRRRTR